MFALLSPQPLIKRQSIHKPTKTVTQPVKKRVQFTVLKNVEAQLPPDHHWLPTVRTGQVGFSKVIRRRLGVAPRPSRPFVSHTPRLKANSVVKLQANDSSQEGRHPMSPQARAILAHKIEELKLMIDNETYNEAILHGHEIKETLETIDLSDNHYLKTLHGQLCFQMGVAYRESDQPDKAVLMLKQSNLLDTDHLFVLAETLKMAKEWTEAIECFERVIARDKEAVLLFDCTLHLVEIYEAMGVYRKAIQAAERLIQQDDSLGASHALLGYYHDLNQQTTEAIQDYKTAIRCEQQSTEPCQESRVRAHVNLANLYNKQQQFDDALCLCERVVDQATLFPDLYQNLCEEMGAAYQALGDMDNAMSWYEKGDNRSQFIAALSIDINKVYS